MYKNNQNQSQIAVKSFIFLATQFRALIELFNGEPQFPKGVQMNLPLSVLAAGPKVVFVIGDSTTLADLPQEGEDAMLGDRVKLEIFEDGRASVHTLPKRSSLTDPIIRELSKTRLPHSIVSKVNKTITVRPGEHAIFFADGEEQSNHAINFERQIAGAEFMIIYTKNNRNGRIEVLDIIDNGKEKTSEAIASFASLMEKFYRKECPLFDHLIKETAPKAEVSSATVSNKDAAKKKTTKAKTAKTVAKVVENAIETIAQVVPTTEAPEPVETKSATKKAKSVSTTADKPKGGPTTRSRRNTPVKPKLIGPPINNPFEEFFKNQEETAQPAGH